MKLHWLLLGVVAALALTIFSGVMQGRMRNRWGPSADTLRAASALAEVPAQFGDWRLLSSDKLDQTSEKMLECAGYFVRNYQNHATGDVVNVTLLLGPPGPISVHTPEICFPSRNYTPLGKREQVTLELAEGGKDQFWALSYKAGNLRGQMLRVYYSWSCGGHWSADGDPRFKYAGQPYLYKIQLFSPLSPDVDLQSDDPCRKFLQDFLPAARKFLFEPEKK